MRHLARLGLLVRGRAVCLVSEAEGEAGQIGGVEGLILGVLVFVLGTLVISSVWGAISAKLASDDAAYEAARAYVQAQSPASAPLDARSAAAAAIRTSGHDPSRMTLALEGALVRCSVVVVTVSYRLPALEVPLIGGRGPVLDVSASHSELVDPFRSGVPGNATCG